MAIDKRISYAWGGPGGKSPGTSASGGTRGGPGPGGQGARGQATQNPGRTTKSAPSRGPVTTAKAPPSVLSRPKATPTKDRPTSFTPKTKTKVDDDLSFEDKKAIAIQKAINPDVYAGINTGDVNIATKIALEPETFTKDELEKGITDDGKTIDYIGDTPVTDKRAKEFNLGLKERNIKTGEIQQGRNIINPFTQEIQSRFAPIDKPKTGFLGTLGNIALGILAPQLLGPKLGQLWSGYTQAKNLSKLASTFTGKDIVSDLTKNLRSNISTSNLIGKRSTTDTTDTRDDRFRGDRGDDRQITPEAPKDVVTAGIEKFSPRQMDLVRQRHEQLQQVIQSGEYMGQRLNNNQLDSLQNASKQMEAFLVDPQKMMMMARGGLAGLHG